MSASLVGSEMCIRDRSREDGPMHEHVWNAWVTCLQSSLPSNVAAAAPVSYTHLTLPTICSV
eukprot:2276914-Alexandrium_andersonii.AAC.1